MNATNASKPNLLQYVAYCYGKRLPDSMRAWVLEDNTGRGAAVRMCIRMTIPAFVMLAPSFFIPMSAYLHISVTLPILLPFVYFAIALNRVWRRFRLSQHGLDPHIIDQQAFERQEHVRASYEARHGR